LVTSVIRISSEMYGARNVLGQFSILFKFYCLEHFF